MGDTVSSHTKETKAGPGTVRRNRDEKGPGGRAGAASLGAGQGFLGSGLWQVLLGPSPPDSPRPRDQRAGPDAPWWPPCAIAQAPAAPGPPGMLDSGPEGPRGPGGRAPSAPPRARPSPRGRVPAEGAPQTAAQAPGLRGPPLGRQREGQSRLSRPGARTHVSALKPTAKCSPPIAAPGAQPHPPGKRPWGPTDPVSHPGSGLPGASS